MSQEPVDVNRYLYEQIYSELKEEILSGKYRKGDWFPPERVLKDRFNTTHLTVRNALAKLVLEGYIERYSGKGTLVIYSRERAPTAKKSLKFPYAHLMLAGLDEANARILELLEAQFRKIPLPVHFSSHNGDVLLEQSLYREAEEKGALVILEPPVPWILSSTESCRCGTRFSSAAMMIRSPAPGSWWTTRWVRERPCATCWISGTGRSRSATQLYRERPPASARDTRRNWRHGESRIGKAWWKPVRPEVMARGLLSGESSRAERDAAPSSAPLMRWQPARFEVSMKRDSPRAQTAP